MALLLLRGGGNASSLATSRGVVSESQFRFGTLIPEYGFRF